MELAAVLLGIMKGLEKIPKVVKRDRFLWWVLVAAALDGDGLMLVPAFLVSSSLPACCQSGSGQGRGSLGQDGGCRAVMWVTICLSPETTLPFTLRCCSSSSRQDKSVLALDTKPYSLLIFSSFIFLFPRSPLVIAYCAGVYKSLLLLLPLLECDSELLRPRNSPGSPSCH